MENLRLQAIEKMEGDMIFCFECDDEDNNIENNTFQHNSYKNPL